MSETVNRPKTLDRLPSLSRKDLLWLGRHVRKELHSRYEGVRARKVKLTEAMQGMANFMAGVTWALACRDSLRRSKDHVGFGKRPASGEMWLPWEILAALRAEIKGRHWSPLGARSWLNVRNWLEIERDRKPEPEHMPALQFQVRMAGQSVSRYIDLADF